MGFTFSKMLAVLVVFLVLSAGIHHAYAAERLIFSPIPETIMPSFPDYSIMAKADLNEDGIDEYILKAPSAQEMFDFNIYALAGEKPISLGHFKGQNVMLGNDYSHGVRNLLVFEDAKNDFRYDIYSWSAKDSRYLAPNVQGEISQP